jgi:TfoX/Sxy family transcriptional regulator of competence genes
VAGKANVIRRKPASMLNRYYKKKGRGNPKLANAYIEKPKYAIDSKQELQNITQAGWKTNRANKKKRQAQNSMLSRVLGNKKK